MKVTIYKDLRSKIGIVKNIELKDFSSTFLVCKDEKERESHFLFSPAIFKNNKRANTNVEALNGVVLDFDNDKEKHGQTLDPEILGNELEKYEWSYYSTFNSTPDCPRFRVVIPFRESVTVESFKAGISYFLDLLGNPEGIDPSTFDIARFFYFPIVKEGHEGEFFSNHYPGSRLLWGGESKKVYKINPSPTPLKKSYSGRNDALKAQVAACINKGKEVQEALKEIIDYDKANHTPPLFEDPSEGGVPGNPIPAALIFLANIQKTYKQAQTTLTITPTISIEEIKAIKPRKEKSFALDKNLLAAPGLVGEIANWITDTASRPQPSLSLAATLSMIGAVKGHRVQTETGLRTNIYTLGLAPSGSGKEHPTNAVKMLLAKSGHELNIIGEPRSGAGLLTALVGARGQGFLPWAEMGQSLKQFTAKGASSHQAEILTNLLQLFSDANGRYIGGEYANHDGKRGRKDIDQPCLSVFASTVPEEFFDALNDSHGSNGFLARWLIFYADDPKVRLRPNKSLGEAPKNFINELIKIKSLSRNVAIRGNVDECLAIHPAVIPYDLHARDFVQDIVSDFEDRRCKALDDGTGLESIWSRAFEHTAKLSLIISTGKFMTRQDIEWSYKIILALLENSSVLFQTHVGKSEFSSLCEKALRLIVSAKDSGIPRWQLRKKLKVEKTKVDQVIEFLIDSNSILPIAEKHGKVTAIKYVAI